MMFRKLMNLMWTQRTRKRMTKRWILESEWVKRKKQRGKFEWKRLT